ncbi:MAG: P-loop NTPase family protein [Cyanobacteria bacterium P01_F01_bin.150]
MVSQLPRTDHRTDHRISPSAKQRFPHLVEGLIQVFTGPRRRFFANVMAQALQQAGQGTSVLIVQFLKGGINQGPDNPTQLAQNLIWLRCNVARCITTAELEPDEISALQELWHYTKMLVKQGKYSLVILDELSVAIELGLIPLDEVLHLLNDRPSHVDVTLCGPHMPTVIMDMADQVTELRQSPRLAEMIS